MVELVSEQTQFKTPGHHPEESKASVALHQVIKNESLVQPQSDLIGFVRKLPLKTANLEGNEISFDWPHSKKDLMDILMKNQQTEVKIEKIFPTISKINDLHVLTGIKLAFSSDLSGMVSFEPPDLDPALEGKHKKGIKIPDGSKSVHIVLVQNEDCFKAVYIFDHFSLKSWKKNHDFSDTWPKVHEYKLSPEETLIGFYGRYGKNCIKSLGPIVYRTQLAESEIQKVEQKGPELFNFKSKRDGLKLLKSDGSDMQGSTQSSNEDKKSKKAKPKAKKGQPACGKEQWKSFL